MLLKPMSGKSADNLRAAIGSIIHMPVPIEKTLETTLTNLPSMDNLDIVVSSTTRAGIKRSDVVDMQKVFSV